MDKEEEYITLLRHFVRVTGALRGEQLFEEWMEFAEGISMKLFGHVSSLYLLYQGNRVRLNEKMYIDFIDHSSINVLTRAAFETALAFHFIFCDSNDIEERHFRFLCWDLAGFLERQGLHTISEEGRTLKAREAKMLEGVKNKIIAHHSFKKYTKKQQLGILKGNWRLWHSWSDIAVKAGYSKEYFESIYSYLCGYAHTGRLSVLQIQQAISRDVQKQLAKVCLDYGLIIISNFLFGYATLFPKVKEAFESDQTEFNIAKMWREIGQQISYNGSDNQNNV
jgi:hypothetical protein